MLTLGQQQLILIVIPTLFIFISKRQQLYKRAVSTGLLPIPSRSRDRQHRLHGEFPNLELLALPHIQQRRIRLRSGLYVGDSEFQRILDRARKPNHILLRRPFLHFLLQRLSHSTRRRPSHGEIHI